MILFVLISFIVGDFLMFYHRLTRKTPTFPVPSPVFSPTPLSSESLKVDVNRAAFEDWVRLPGIGPKKARAILAYRQAQGGFHRLEDLLKVKGIGPKLLERLRPYLKIDTFESPGGKVP